MALTLYTTCPSSNDMTASAFRRHMLDVARWTESAGFRGLLIYTDNTLVDPWAAAQLMIAETSTLVPLVAVQPLYMHPYSVARMISTIAFLYGRRVDLNLVTGGFGPHLRALGCHIEHDERYDRLIEYGTIIQQLLSEQRRVTASASYYQLAGATISPPIDPALMPGCYLSGSSPASVRASRSLGATRLAYPRPIEEYDDAPEALAGTGIRVGLIARDTEEEAWQVALARFPEDRQGEQLHDLAARMVESHWHRELSVRALQPGPARPGYWMYPFRTYRTFCPYLVGSHDQVAGLLSGYLRHGITTLITDVPPDEEDLHHSRRAIDLAMARWRAPRITAPT